MSEDLPKQTREPEAVANDIREISVLARGILDEESTTGHFDEIYNETGRELGKLGHELRESELQGVKTQDEAAAQLEEELRIAEDIQKHIDRLKAQSKKETKSDPKTTQIKGSAIGWLPSKEDFELAIEEVKNGEEPFFFASITDKDNIADKAFKRLETQKESEGLLASLKSTVLPKLWRQITSGDSQARPIAIGNRSRKQVKSAKSLNTVYPAYKVDVHGTSNRAIVLLTDKVDGKPVFVLAALYDHEDQSNILNHMYLKSNGKK